MKNITIIVCILTLILASTIYVENELKTKSKLIVGQLKEIKEDINNSKIGIEEKIKEVLREWKKTDEKWSIIILHNELDLIETSLISIKSNIENKEHTRALEEIDKSIFLLEHTVEKEKFKLKNIF